MKLKSTSNLWKIWGNLDLIIWYFNWELTDAPALEDHLRDILDDLKKEIMRLDTEAIQ